MSTLVPRVLEWDSASDTLSSDRLDIRPVLVASPLFCYCVLGSPPKHTQILVLGSQEAQTKVQGQTNDKTPYYGVLNIYIEQGNTFFSAAGHMYTNKQTAIAMYVTFGENPREKPVFEAFPKYEAPTKWCLCLDPLPSPADRRLHLSFALK